MAALELRIAARQREEERRHQERLERMTPEERKEYEREQQRIAREQERDNKRYWRDRSKAFDYEGASLGASSADQVNLNRNASAEAHGRKEL
jgi:hypothetical protein